MLPHMACKLDDAASWDRRYGVELVDGHWRRTHCPNGHRYTPQNTFWEKNLDGKPYQRCRTCFRSQRRLRYERKKERAQTVPQEDALLHGARVHDGDDAVEQRHTLMQGVQENPRAVQIHEEEACRRSIAS